MNIFRFLFISLFCFVLVTIQSTYAAINYSVTPIRYELELQPWESISLPASIRNNGDETVTLPTTTSDFQSSGPNGVPSLVRKSELVFPDQELSSWITLWSESVTVAPWQEWTINFTIDVPTTATPGWHYWAVLFRNPGSETWGGNISINVDYWIIILVNVSGDVITEVEIEDPIISGWWTGWYWNNNSNSWSWETTDWNIWWDDNSDNNVNNNENTDDSSNDWWYLGTDPQWNPVIIYPDECPLWDFTTSKYDKKCFWTTDPDLFSDNGIPNDLWEWILFEDEFEVKFQFPIKNTWNTHIKPTWKIVLKDENGIIKAIWREVIANDRGAIIDQKIVDYVPINDQWWNILPGTKRVFESSWEWFPYKTFDDEWNPIVNYWSPSEYYTQKNKEDAGFLMFWERVSENRTHKDITADIELVYYDEEWNPIEFNTSKTFTVQYIEQVVSINPYIIVWLLLILAAILLTLGAIRWWIILFKENKCWNCDEKIKSHWKTCPHCRAIQNKRKHRAFEKQKELWTVTTPTKKVIKKTQKTPAKTKVSTAKTTKKKTSTTRKSAAK